MPPLSGGMEIFMRKQYNALVDFLGSLVKSNISFKSAGEKIEVFIKSLTKNNFIEIVKEIGTIPEAIEASSTEEKLYSKASDFVLARCFNELGL